MSNEQEPKTIKTVEEFIAWVESLSERGHKPLYRGLADSSWKMESSAHRRVVDRDATQRYIINMLNVARLRDLGRQDGSELSDLKLLAKLQHNGAATCLIDFTANPLIALWFACKDLPEKCGKVAAAPTDNIKNFNDVNYEQEQEWKIEKFFDEWKLWRWKPGDMNNRRSIAQQSVFIFTSPTYGDMSETFCNYVKIPAESKKDIIKNLSSLGITEESMFPDFSGFALSNAHDKPYSNYEAAENLRMGSDLHQKGKPCEAIQYYDEAIRLNKSDNNKDAYTYTYFTRGNAKVDCGDFTGAIEDYDEVIRLDKNSVLAYYNRGRTKVRLGRLDDAIEDFSKVIELNPLSPAYYDRGITNLKLSKFTDAIADFNRIIEIHPTTSSNSLGDILKSTRHNLNSLNLADIYNSLGIAEANSSNLPDAIKDFNKAIELDQNIEPYRNIAAAYYNNRGIAKANSNKLPDAIEDFSKAIELDQKLAAAYYNRGIARQHSGDSKSSQEDIDKAIALDSNIDKKQGYYWIVQMLYHNSRFNLNKDGSFTRKREPLYTTRFNLNTAKKQDDS